MSWDLTGKPLWDEDDVMNSNCGVAIKVRWRRVNVTSDSATWNCLYFAPLACLVVSKRGIVIAKSYGYPHDAMKCCVQFIKDLEYEYTRCIFKGSGGNMCFTCSNCRLDCVCNWSTKLHLSCAPGLAMFTRAAIICIICWSSREGLVETTRATTGHLIDKEVTDRQSTWICFMVVGACGSCICLISGIEATNSAKCCAFAST